MRLQSCASAVVTAAIVACALTATAQNSCTDQNSCFQSATAQVLESIRVAYLGGGATPLETQVWDCYDATCAKSAVGPVSFPNHRTNLDNYTGGQGFGPVNHDLGTIQGYAQIVDGNKERAPLPSIPSRGFTVEITAAIPPAGQNTTLTLMKIKNQGRMIWGAFWENDHLLLRRQTPRQQTDIFFAVDSPWDTSRGAISTKFPVPPATDPIPWTALNSDKPLLVEFYFTFTPDGKLRIDFFNVNKTDHDQWIEKLVDTGFPVAIYPQQIGSTGPWQPAQYYPDNVVRVGEEGQNSPLQGLFQYVLFRPLSLNEILAYHKANEFFNGQNKPSTQYMQFDQLPCNTGNYLNVPPTQSIATPCGQITGIGQVASN